MYLFDKSFYFSERDNTYLFVGKHFFTNLSSVN